VWVEHGFLPGMPGTEESISITLDEACNWLAGSAFAQLLALPYITQNMVKSWFVRLPEMLRIVPRRHHQGKTRISRFSHAVERRRQSIA
jgi:hypothetical protein